MPSDITTAVLRNSDLGHGNHLLEFRAPEMAAEMQPAQFFMVGIPGSATLLRRPYSVCGLPGTFDGRPDDAVQVLYKVVGRGTGLLATLKTGAEITVLGPLGRGFSRPANPRVRPVFVAGGIGAAPYPALAASLADHRLRPRMFYGARSAADLPLLDWFREHCDEVVVTTEDGSLGHAGLVTAPLEDLLGREPADALQIYACGPEPMLKAVARLARERAVACELSLEAHMACGFGVCLGCVVPTRREGTDSAGYDRVCVEGPVMSVEKLAW
jgi:dihydroorotate dehydrogenase electron transfer subunit